MVVELTPATVFLLKVFSCKNFLQNIDSCWIALPAKNYFPSKIVSLNTQETKFTNFKNV